MNAFPTPQAPAVSTAAQPDFVPAPLQPAVAAVEEVAKQPTLANVESAVKAGEDVLASPTGQLLKAQLPTIVRESKAGYKTTEFWLVVATLLSDVVSGLSVRDKVVTSAVSGIYAVARGLAKNGVPDIAPAPPVD